MPISLNGLLCETRFRTKEAIICIIWFLFPMGRRRRNNKSRTGNRGGTFRRGRNPVSNMTKRISDGLFRLRDTLTLSSGSTGNIAQIISRSYTQFAESKSIETLFTEVKLISFEVSITPARIYAKTDSDEKNLSMGWMAIGTNPTTTVVAATSGDQVLAQSDSREFFLRNRIRPFHFRSAVLSGGYKFTPFLTDTTFAFAGNPGSIYINNMLSSSEAASTDLMYCIISGIYQFTGRTA